ncbi:hypothetical protein CARUB_v10006673mg [Capsella rubella]|uniref:Zinc finger PHD-type domain-containing protein n=1 Tax=Capsella rubella TaxID=81985 RepID=R0GMR6_9BRAS|nr:uncharacterized protein LOC17879388 [Capsella rubella]EOA18194.1 hypothetical protein CARUB_v10006673mg [Capsella rubella]
MEILDKMYTLIPTRGLKCDGCNLGKNYHSDGYRCFHSGLFFHKECANSDLEISNQYHPQHSLYFKAVPKNEGVYGECKICRGNLPKLYYYCSICDFSIDLICAKKEVIITIEDVKTHEHCLTLVPKMVMFTCHICGLLDDRFPYACELCKLSFHRDCAESIAEVNYSCHPKHILKRLTHVSSYTNEKCCLCRTNLNNLFYHCYVCNFSVDINCAKNPPPFTLVHPKAHEHSLTLMPQRKFLCNACGIEDDPNPYVCLPCNFMIHKNCIDMPRVIKINRHNHRIYYKSFLDMGDWKCGVCHKKMTWTFGAYSCSKCPDLAFHLRCATKFGIWDGIELEDISENSSEVKSYEMIEEGVITHFSHTDHTLKLKEKSEANDKYMWCKACFYPIFLNPFYICTKCDDFILHKKCAFLPQKKIDSFYKMSITLITRPDWNDRIYVCSACQYIFQGFHYKSDDGNIILDVRCGSISDSFAHESHPLHSLYINYSTEEKICNACGDKTTMVLSCEDCGYYLDIKCSILPKMVKHKNDIDHFLFLCYGEKTREQYWCEICEEELDSEQWFYLCEHCGLTFHIKCTLGDFIWMKPKTEDDSSRVYVIPNNRITRPICYVCHSRCQFSSVLSFLEEIFCSVRCIKKKFMEESAIELDND